MKRRKLPSAIRRSGDERPPAQARPPVQHEAAVLPREAAGGKPAAAAVDIIEPGGNGAGGAAIQVLPPRSAEAQERHARALAMVERHGLYSAAGGAIPLPIVNLAGVTALNVHLVKRLCEVYGLPFERERARAVVLALIGGIAPGGLGMITASTLGALVPMSALIGLAVSSASALVCTRAIGKTLVEHFEDGKTLHDLPLWP